MKRVCFCLLLAVMYGEPARAELLIEITAGVDNPTSIAVVPLKIDAGSGKTYQPNYHMDHVRPGTYIEPGMGMEQGHERGLFSQRGGGFGGDISESNR